jgi:hypothetical protein
MREIIDRCNVCEIAKAEANHWYLMIQPANASPYFVEWDEYRAGEEGIGHICGARCGHKAIDAWFNARQQALMESRRIVPELRAAFAPQYPEANLPDPAPVADTVEQFETLESPQEADQFQDIPF